MKTKKLVIILFLLINCIFKCLSQLQFNVTYEDNYPEILENYNLTNTNNNFLKSFAESQSKYNPDKMRPLLRLCVGKPKQCFRFLMQTNSFHILLSDIDSKLITCENKFEWRKSSTLIKKQIEVTLRYYNTKVIGWEAIDEFFKGVNDDESDSYGKLLFLVISQGGKYTKEEGILGLGYDPSDDEKKFSFIHQLYNKGKIPHKVFSHKLLDNENGVITIGAIPQNIVNDYFHYGRCKALDKIRNGKNYKNNNWECHLDYIIFGNNKIEIDGLNINFLAFRKKSFLPKKIFTIFYENYFKKYIDDGLCIIYNANNEEDQTYSYLECVSFIIFEPLSLVFGDWQITFKDEDLFQISIDGLKKRFIFCQKENYEKFLFGLSILRKVEMVYDYANKEVGFYSENVLYIGKDQNPPPPKTFDFLEDDEESQAKVVKDEENDLFPITEAEEKKDNNIEPVKTEKKINLLKILENILKGGILLCGIVVVGVFFILFMRFKNRKKLKEAQKYLKKKLVEEKA